MISIAYLIKVKIFDNISAVISYAIIYLLL